MNHLETSTSVSFIEKITIRFLPKESKGELYFWLTLPFVALVLTLSLALAKTSSFTSFLIPISFVGVFISLFFRKKGLSVAFFMLFCAAAIFFKTIPAGTKLWHTGIIFSLALDFILAYLAMDMAEETFSIFSEESNKQKERIRDLGKLLDEAGTSIISQRETLLEEIQKIKDEAENRRIEKESVEKKISTSTFGNYTTYRSERGTRNSGF